MRVSRPYTSKEVQELGRGRHITADLLGYDTNGQPRFSPNRRQRRGRRYARTKEQLKQRERAPMASQSNLEANAHPAKQEKQQKPTIWARLIKWIGAQIAKILPGRG